MSPSESSSPVFIGLLDNEDENFQIFPSKLLGPIRLMTRRYIPEVSKPK